MTRSTPFLVLMFGALATAVFATDIILLDGRVFKDASIFGQTPLRVTIKYAAGLASVDKKLLPADLQARYPADAAAAVVADQQAAVAREKALEAQKKEAERLAKLRAQTEATVAATAIAAESEADRLKAERKLVMSHAGAFAENYFVRDHDPWLSDTTPVCTATIADASPIEGWPGRWLVTGRAVIENYPNHDTDWHDGRSFDREIDRSSEIIDFECRYSTDGSEPTIDVKQHTYVWPQPAPPQKT